MLTGQIFDIRPHSASCDLDTLVFHLLQVNFVTY